MDGLKRRRKDKKFNVPQKDLTNPYSAPLSPSPKGRRGPGDGKGIRFGLRPFWSRGRRGTEGDGRDGKVDMFEDKLISNEVKKPLVRVFRGHHYVMGEEFQYKTKDHRFIPMVRWHSHCADCGSSFSCIQFPDPVKFSPNRRCKGCKKPLVRVRKRWIG